MTSRALRIATLTETMYRLAEQVHGDRNRKLGTSAGTILGIAAERMLLASSNAYNAARDEYRAIKGAHASIPNGCRLY